ncbi:hypothetical protein Tco_0756805 [Tanacetum coccineum]
MEGSEKHIVLPESMANHFEIKTNLLQLVQANPFYGRESENPHAYINSFKRNTSTLRLGTLPSNTIPNLKGEMKAITTRSGVAYEGPLIPTNPSPKEVVERETEETTDKEQTNFKGSTAQIPPPVIPISIPKPDVPKICKKHSIRKKPIFPKSLN